MPPRPQSAKLTRLDKHKLQPPRPWSERPQLRRFTGSAWLMIQHLRLLPPLILSLKVMQITDI